MSLRYHNPPDYIKYNHRAIRNKHQYNHQNTHQCYIPTEICGQSCDDAYRLLDNYLSNLKHYFRKQESAEEIINDIEMRIAELFRR